ncbi:uncharacterized protein LOC129907732 [Episyrphus balteatus]|uniref:uncharacterized protein LOC129907732 n=1 Tax=Episyrphus balteatus TaxID=286459 RepID=UPI002485BB79|nr:uncharacterized protein LOC129907732 [Episyrphus balteatus]XP_055840054.1 uncharacterized protein LOC129907732 [Episyrphus balteatus]
MDYNIVFERVEGRKGDEETLVENVLRFTRSGTDYLINGRLTYHDILGEDVTHEVTTAYSADGSSLFRLHPYTVQKSSLCEFYKTFYREYGQPWIKDHTDFPYIPEGGLCPLPKGSWYVKDMKLLNGTKVPLHAPRGLWKVEQKIERKGKVIGGLTIYARVSDLI